MCKFNSLCKRLVVTCLFAASISSVSAAVFTVTSNSGAGAGSLDAAIASANASPGVDTITFNIPGGGVQVISIAATLSSIDEAVFINGYSQPGSVAGAIGSRTINVVLDGSASSGAIALLVAANDVQIAGLNIRNFPGGGGVATFAPVDNLWIWGSYFGTNETGTAAASLGLGAIAIGFDIEFDGYANNDGSTNVIIGTNGDGTGDANEGNLLSGNATAGYDALFMTGVTGSKVSGNYFGVTSTGGGTLSNGRHGVVLHFGSTGNIIGTDGNGTSDALEANVFGHNDIGIGLYNQSNGNTIAGNLIGISPAGADEQNATGILIHGSSSNIVGPDFDGTADVVEKNTISYNFNAIKITAGADAVFDATGHNASGNIIQGNYIGTLSNGTGNAGNKASAVVLESQATFTNNLNIIGSDNDGDATDAAEGNIIANSLNDGVTLTAAGTTVNNLISRNLIFNNGAPASTNGHGIDWFADGPSANSTAAPDFPVIESITTSGTQYIVTGYAPAGSFIEFYKAQAATAPTAPFTKFFTGGDVFYFRAQEGGTINLIADADGTTGATYTATQEGNTTWAGGTTNKFSFIVPVSLMPGLSGSGLTAIAYNAAGNTSEFAGVFPYALVTLPVNITSFSGLLKSGKVNLTWTTAAEVNNSHFEIERSTDGVNYTSVGQLSGRSINSTYSFVDENPSAINFYRLKQVDKDGRATFSKVLLIRKDGLKGAVKISPNPFVSNLNIAFNLEKAQTVQIRLIDQLGRVIRTQNVGGSQGTNFINIADLGGLARGQYFIELKGDDILVKEKLIK